MKKKLFLDFYNDPALVTVARKSVKVSFYYEADIEKITRALEKALAESGFCFEYEWAETKKGGVK